GAKFWLSVMTELKNRGVQDILVACVDGLKGFPDAIASVYPHTVGQGAIRYHFLPNASVYANIGSAFRAPTLNELYSQWGGN
ncbi:TonB-dependent receptor domain-containing protein, partial [Acinetobacter nosocomialis]|uniref:TonB-dependent receptor domain-containing protein n=1 Tax=Acinetobacter nosocomialis TaxID=106654 RepID=UPI00208FA0B6